MTKIFSFRANDEEQKTLDAAIEASGFDKFKDFSLAAATTWNKEIADLQGVIKQYDADNKELKQSLNGQFNLVVDRNEEIEKLKEELAIANTPKAANPLHLTIQFEDEAQKANFIALMERNKLDTPLALFKALYKHVKQSLFKDLEV